MDSTEELKQLLADILSELKSISEYINYKKREEMLWRNIQKSLPSDELNSDLKIYFDSR